MSKAFISTDLQIHFADPSQSMDIYDIVYSPYRPYEAVKVILTSSKRHDASTKGVLYVLAVEGSSTYKYPSTY